jgi:SAM-dependent methyltransferase
MNNYSNLSKRDNCRLCGSSQVEMIYPMPTCPPVDNYRFEGEPEIELPAFPMDMYMCIDCGHAQLLDVVDPQILFGNYIYTSSSSPDLDKHFSEYAKQLVSFAALSKDSFGIDIGSNDGLFLSKLQAFGLKVLGIDASETVANEATKNNIKTIVSFLNEDVVNSIKIEFGLADIVTANNVFSHSDDLIGFAKCAKSLLADEGLFVFEVSYLKDLVQFKVVDYIYHEHLAHHSVKPLKQFMTSIGMKLINVEHVATKGGSIRCYAALENAKWPVSDIVNKFIISEEEVGLYKKETYIQLKQELDNIGQDVVNYLKPFTDNKQLIASYGASATATVLNEMFQINQYISFIVDDNPARQGRLSPYHKIPVRSKDFLVKETPVVTFISSWRFADMIIKNNQAYLDKGGIFLVPLPEFKVIKN